MPEYKPEPEKWTLERSSEECSICEHEQEDKMICWENAAGYFAFCLECLKETPKSAWDSSENKIRNKQEFLRWWHESAALGEPISEETWEEDYQ